MQLYGYWRSSASYRVRIALHLKALDFEYKAVHLIKDGGEQKSADYGQLNPAQLVPTLVDGDLQLNQSLAIIEYLDSLSGPRLLPEDAKQAAIVRMLAYDMACDLQPIVNLRILQYVSGTLEAGDEGRSAWIKHWVDKAFTAFESRLQTYAGTYCVGDQVTLADLCLVPQVYNAQRFGVDLTPYPTLMAVHDRLQQLPAFAKARPEAQPDAVV
ncbi:maleylacetoacetate isomerase [Aliidiomarina minuta]|uniref:Maleylacetoacetate isomerase n=1 Tax=Aliidiomarina minuta TaxID=880057 RepID=A0A432W6S8_9GAMM|nr:maleylacetoacetate isomerase [Aliidiomarina minuta]RUO25784.1 maleylacetoacetate isomerase [Aliidiomarina minuta]